MWNIFSYRLSTSKCPLLLQNVTVLGVHLLGHKGLSLLDLKLFFSKQLIGEYLINNFDDISSESGAVLGLHHGSISLDSDQDSVKEAGTSSLTLVVRPLCYTLHA